MALSPGRRRGRPPLHDRADLLDAASRTLVERGYESMRYGDVSETAGVPITSLQHHFPTLDQLRREALVHAVRVELDTVTGEVQAARDAWRRLDALVDSAVAGPARRRRSFAPWLTLWSVAGRDPQVAEISTELTAEWSALIRSIVAGGVAAKSFAPEGSVDQVTEQLRSFIAGLGVLATTEPFTGTPKQASAAALAAGGTAARLVGAKKRKK